MSSSRLSARSSRLVVRGKFFGFAARISIRLVFFRSRTPHQSRHRHGPVPHHLRADLGLPPVVEVGANKLLNPDFYEVRRMR